MGDAIAVAVQHGNAIVVMVATGAPGDGLTLGVTISPDICRVAGELQTVQGQAETQKHDLRQQVPVLP